jgi:nicotinamide-nucleotide amidase
MIYGAIANINYLSELILDIGDVKDKICTFKMQGIVYQIHKALIKNKKTLAVAESCTGGLVSSLLTQLSGSSGYFILGIVAYQNRVKTNILKVPAGLIVHKGAVSAAVALIMAQQVRKLAKSDLGIGVTGIAGPTGGSPQKPVGTVFIAAAAKNKKICRGYHFKGSRTSIRNKAALKSMELLKKII